MNERETQPHPTSGKILWIIIAISIAIHVACLVLSNTLLQDWRWEHHPVHASVEMAGGIVALLVALLLLSLEQREAGTSFNVWISGALIAMGLLDGFHALVHVGQPFVWLHSLATFFGGLLFSLVWIPKLWTKKVSRWWTWAVFVVVMVAGTLSLAFPDFTPRMLRPNAQGQMVFSPWANVLNLAGGVLMLVAAVKMIRQYFRDRNTDDLLFCLHCVLFGAAAIMFEQSVLWDITWWGWHLLRLMAYVVALWFLVLSILREQQAIEGMTVQLKESKNTLEQKVLERTNEVTLLNEELEQRVQRRTRQLEEAQEQLVRNERLATLGQLAGGVAHEIRNPMGVIRNSLFFLQQIQDNSDEDAAEALEEIARGLANSERIVAELLDFARDPEADVSLFPLDEAITAAVGMVKKPSNVEIKRPEAFDTLVNADRDQVERLFSNLMQNATQAMPKGGTLTLRCELNNGHVITDVSDTGVGIPEDEQEKIFEPLYTKRAKGIGLGLSLCRRYAELNGGTLAVESKLGEGSTFRVTLPLAKRTERD